MAARGKAASAMPGTTYHVESVQQRPPAQNRLAEQVTVGVVSPAGAALS